MKVLSLTLSTPRFHLPVITLPVAKWIAVARQRARLAQLSDEALTDLGIDRAEAEREAARPFWDTPRSLR